MSIISDKIQTEIDLIDIKALIIERVTLKVDNRIDKILENRNIPNEVNQHISDKVLAEVRKSMEK